MNENQRPWTSEETITVFAAVEQCRATGGRLDWRAIAATVPGRSEQAAQAQVLQKHSCTRRTGLPAPQRLEEHLCTRRTGRPALQRLAASVPTVPPPV